MPTLRELMPKLLADGKIDPQEVDVLFDLVYSNGVVDAEEADFLVLLNRRVERPSPAFERFYFAALKRYLLSGNGLDAEKTRWLQRVVCSDSRMNNREKRLLRELKGEASQTCPEFETLYAVYGTS
jgi:uncharacterized tellurite resistance protein B-like protein